MPIVDDFDGALRAASTALAGFREQNEPFVAFAALTVGMLEMTLGQDQTAREYLLEVNELGAQVEAMTATSDCSHENVAVLGTTNCKVARWSRILRHPMVRTSR